VTSQDGIDNVILDFAGLIDKAMAELNRVGSQNPADLRVGMTQSMQRLVILSSRQ
jgi:hypothetical protein